MSGRRGLLILTGLLLLALIAAVLVGETGLRPEEYLSAFTDPAGPAGEILWTLRAPRATRDSICSRTCAMDVHTRGPVLLTAPPRSPP